MVVREKNCYYAIALTDFFVFLSCAEKINIRGKQIVIFINDFYSYSFLKEIMFVYHHNQERIP